MNIGNYFNNHRTNIIKYLTKGVGIAALGIIAYDAHIIGKLQADTYSKSKDANACMTTYNNTQYLSSPSTTTAVLKEKVHEIEMDSNWRHFINSGIGYFKGFNSMLIDSVIPLGLGLAALLGKGKASQGSAIGLGVYAVLKFFKDVIGLGQSNDLNKKY